MIRLFFLLLVRLLWIMLVLMSLIFGLVGNLEVMSSVLLLAGAMMVVDWKVIR